MPEKIVARKGKQRTHFDLEEFCRGLGEMHSMDKSQENRVKFKEEFWSAYGRDRDGRLDTDRTEKLDDTSI